MRVWLLITIFEGLQLSYSETDTCLRSQLDAANLFLTENNSAFNEVSSLTDAKSILFLTSKFGSTLIMDSLDWKH